MIRKDAVYTYVKQAFEQQYQVKRLKQMGFNNTYALIMRKEDVKQLGIRTSAIYLNIQR